MTAICTITGFLGYATADGRPAHMKVEAGQEFGDDDQVVVSRPDVFRPADELEAGVDEAPPAAPKPTRRPPKRGSNG